MGVKDIDKGWKRVKRALFNLNGSYTKVGIQSDAESDDGTSMAEIAAYNEFGTADIPSRPFMRTTFLKKMSQLKELQDQQYYKILNLQANPSMALGTIGAWYTGEVQDIITNNYWKPNAPATIRAKGSSKPLIDTGRMRASITHVEVIK